MVASVRPVLGAVSVTATIALPSVVAEFDILVIHAETEDVTHAPPSGWAQVTGSPLSQATAPATRHHLWWKRAGASESNVSHSITGLDHRIAYMYAVRGCPTTGDPFDATATDLDNSTDTAADCPGLTTTEVNTCITCHMTTGFDRGTNSSTWHSGWTNSSLQTSSAMVAVNALTELRDNTNNTGSGGTVGMATGFNPAAGTVDATPVTVVDATTKAMHTVSWKSAVPAIDPTLAEGRTENASPYVTQIIAAKANSKLVMSVLVSGTSVATPTVTGLSLTWTVVGTPVTVGGTGTKLCWFESTQVGGSDVSGQVTITVGTTPTGCSWSIYQVTGMAATGTIVQNPTVTSVGQVSTLTITFAAAADAVNRPVVAYGIALQNTGNTITPESGWVEGAEQVRSTPNAKLWTAYQPTTFDTSTSITEDSTYDISASGIEVNFVQGKTLDGTLTGTASLTGGVTSDKPVAGDRATTATLTGGITSDKPVGGALVGTATLTGAAAREATATGTLTGTATLTGAASREAAAAGTLTATASLTGGMAREASATGALAGTATLSGAATSDKPTAGALTGSWAAAGGATVGRDAAGTLAGTAALTGATTSDKPTGGTLAATMTLSGALDVLGTKELDGDTTTVFTAAGDATTTKPVTGVLAATVTLSGALELSGSPDLAGTLTETFTATGAVGLAKPTDGTLPGVYTTVGDVSTGKPVSGAFTATMGLAGDLSIGAPPVVLDGNHTATFTTTGEATKDTAGAGALAASAGFAGAIGVTRTLGGTLAATAVLVGALTVEKPLTGNLAATMARTGGATVEGEDARSGVVPGPVYTRYSTRPPYVEDPYPFPGYGEGGYGEGPYGG